MSGHRQSNAEREQRLTETYETLTTAVEELVKGEDWARMLATAARFHRYSFGNVMLILAQLGDATRVAGYRDWQKMGRQVRRGEVGAYILRPTFRSRRADPDAALSGQSAVEVEVVDEGVASRDERSPGERARVLSGFWPVKVFDVSQTDGPPLPDVRPELLSGDATAGLFDGLAVQVDAKGFTIVREDCSPANGMTNFTSRTVTVRPDLSPAQAAKTLAHELAHIALGHEERGPAGMHEGIGEVEAESVAYLVCATAGLPTGDYSFPYVARWADGDIALVRSTADRALDTARSVTSALGLTPSAPDVATTAVLDRGAAQTAQPSSATPSPVPAVELVR